MNATRQADFDRAYAMGRAFALGQHYAKRKKALIKDDEKVIFRKTDNGQTIAIKEGGIVGGAGTHVGPDKLPTFDVYRNAHPGKSFSAQVKRYCIENFCEKIRSIKNTGALPPGIDRVVFTKVGAKEMANHISETKVLVLPYIPDILRTGTDRGFEPEKSHHQGNYGFTHTEKTISVSGRRLKVIVECKVPRNLNGSVAEAYVIGKADIIDRKKTGSDMLTGFRNRGVREPVGRMVADSPSESKLIAYFCDFDVIETKASPVKKG